MPTIYLSPAAAGYRSVVGGNEDLLRYTDKIMQEMVPYLEASGIQTGINRPNMTAEEAIRESNTGMYDVHLAIVSDDLPLENEDLSNKAEVYYRPEDPRSERLANIIVSNIESILPRSYEIQTAPTHALGEVSQTHAPAVLIEITYHDNPETETWVRQNINNIARNLALSVAQYFEVPYLEPTQPRSGVVDLNSGILNIRAQPDAHAPIVATAKDGDPVTVLGEWNHWFLIRSNDHTGYAPTSSITVVY